MTPETKTFDTKCRDLAIDWLDDHAPTATIHSLASAIQQAIENWEADQAEMDEGVREAASDAAWQWRLDQARGK